MSDQTPEDLLSEEIARKVVAETFGVDTQGRIEVSLILHNAIREAVSSARSKALEEAARVADLHDLGPNGETTEGIAFNVAKAIRALAKEAPRG